MGQPEAVKVAEIVGGTEITGTAVSDLQPLLEGVVAAFVEQSEQWRDGFSILIGWGPLKLKAVGGNFEIVSPDYTADPFEDETSDLSSALYMMLGLMTVPGKAGLEPTEVRFDDDIIAVESWEQSRMLQLSRIETNTPGDSGWFIEPFPPRKDEAWKADELVRVWAWTAVQIRTAIGQVLSLPVGANAIIEGDAVRAIVDGESLEVLATDIVSDDRKV